MKLCGGKNEAVAVALQISREFQIQILFNISHIHTHVTKRAHKSRYDIRIWCLFNLPDAHRVVSKDVGRECVAYRHCYFADDSTEHIVHTKCSPGRQQNSNACVAC